MIEGIEVREWWQVHQFYSEEAPTVGVSSIGAASSIGAGSVWLDAPVEEAPTVGSAALVQRLQSEPGLKLPFDDAPTVGECSIGAESSIGWSLWLEAPVEVAFTVRESSTGASSSIGEWCV